MSDSIRCYHCGEKLSVMDKKCPKCGVTVGVLSEIRYQVEHSRLYLAGVCLTVLLLLGIGWYLRLDWGVRWPIYVVLVVVAPLVPWLLKLIYQVAAPTGDIPQDDDGQQ